jgi:hypothetical protein
MTCPLLLKLAFQHRYRETRIAPAIFRRKVSAMYLWQGDLSMSAKPSLNERFASPLKGVFADCGRVTGHLEITRFWIREGLATTRPKP